MAFLGFRQLCQETNDLWPRTFQQRCSTPDDPRRAFTTAYSISMVLEKEGVQPVLRLTAHPSNLIGTRFNELAD